MAANHTEHWFGESKNDKEEPIMDSWHDSWTQISNISDIVLRMYVLKKSNNATVMSGEIPWSESEQITCLP